MDQTWATSMDPRQPRIELLAWGCWEVDRPESWEVVESRPGRLVGWAVATEKKTYPLVMTNMAILKMAHL